MAFFGLIMYTLIIYLRPQEIFPDLWSVELVMYSILATLVLAILTEPVDLRRLLRRPALVCLLGFLASAVLSHLSHLYLTGAKDSFQEVAKLVLPAVLIGWIVNTPSRLRLYIWMLLALATLLAIQGIQQSITGLNWGGFPMWWHWTWEYPRIRGLGIFNDPNDLALALVFMVPFALGPLAGGVLPRSSLVGLPILALLLYGIYLTHSRGGVLALGVSVAVLILRRSGQKAAIPLAAAAGVGLMALGPGRLVDALTSDSSAMDRLWLWSEGLQMLKGAPLFGIGQGLFMDYVAKAAHNSVILALAETGLVGGFFWIATFYFAARDLMKVAGLQDTKDSQVRELASIAGTLLAGMAGYLTAAFFLSRTYVVILYIPLGLVVACARIAERYVPALTERARATERDWRWIAGLEICAILGVYILVRTIRW